MSGIELKTTHTAAEVKVGSDGKRTYTAQYLAKMDDAADGPAAVLDFLETRNISFDVPYSYNGDTDVTAFCQGITPRRKPGSVEWWDVTVQYGPKPEDDSQQDEDGNPSDDPDEWRWQHTMGYSTWQEAVWAAYNVTAFPHIDKGLRPTSFHRAPLVYGPVVNSANVVLDPPLMHDLFDRVWQITAFSRKFTSSVSDNYMGAINNTAAQYHTTITSKYNVNSDTFAMWEIKCTNATATYQDSRSRIAADTVLGVVLGVSVQKIYVDRVCFGSRNNQST